MFIARRLIDKNPRRILALSPTFQPLLRVWADDSWPESCVTLGIRSPVAS
jgi:hypothetical protein